MLKMVNQMTPLVLVTPLVMVSRALWSAKLWSKQMMASQQLGTSKADGGGTGGAGRTGSQRPARVFWVFCVLLGLTTPSMLLSPAAAALGALSGEFPAAWDGRVQEPERDVEPQKQQDAGESKASSQDKKAAEKPVAKETEEDQNTVSEGDKPEVPSGPITALIHARVFTLNQFTAQNKTSQQKTSSEETSKEENSKEKSDKEKSDEETSKQPSILAEVSAPAEVSALAEVSANAATETDLARNAVLENATILLQDGKILAIGTQVEIPAGATTIDLQGMTVTPGLVDLRTSAWLTSAAAAESANDASLDAIDGVDFYAPAMSEVLASGVTSVYVQPAAAGNLGGYGATLSTGTADHNGDAILLDKSGFQMSIGVNAFGSSRDRHQQFDRLQKTLKAAQEYQKLWDDYREQERLKEEAKAKAEKEKAKAEPKDAKSGDAKNGESGAGDRSKEGDQSKQTPTPAPDSGRRGMGRGRGSRGGDVGSGKPVVSESPQEADKDKKESSEKPDESKTDEKKADGEKKEEKKELPKPKFDPAKERLLPALAGKVPVRFEVHRADDLQRALKLAEEFKLSVILEGLTDLKSGAKQATESQLPVVLGPWLETDPTAIPADDRWALWSAAFAGENARQNRLAIATFSSTPTGSKWLRAQAAKAISCGFDRDRVLEAITIVPAQLAGVGDQVGSIEVGKLADLVIFAGDPLDWSTAVVAVIRRGEVTEAAQVALADRNARQETADQDKRAQDSNSNESNPVHSLAGEQLAKNAAQLKKDMAAIEQVNRLTDLPKRFAIKSAHMLSVDGTYQDSWLVIEDGKVVSRGDGQMDMGTTPVFDLGALPVTPGLVSGYMPLASQAAIENESDASQVTATDEFDAQADAVRDSLNSGVTAALLANSSQNVVAGKMGIVRFTDFGEVVSDRAAQQWVLTAAARNPQRYPASLASQLKMLRDRIDGETPASRVFVPPSVLVTLQAERVADCQDVASGKLPVVIEVRSDVEMDAALDLIESAKLNAWLQGPQQLKPFVERLVRLNVGVIADGVSPADYDWYLDDLVAANQAGVPLLLGGAQGERLRLTAGGLVSRGVAPEAALRWLTIETQAEFAPEVPVGLSEGAAADVVVWSASPLDISAKPLLIIVDGKLQKND